MNYNHLSHTHCWNNGGNDGIPPCGIPMEKHEQCCLCDLKMPNKTHTDVEGIVEEFTEYFGDFLDDYICCSGKECNCSGVEALPQAKKWLRATLQSQADQYEREKGEMVKGIVADYMEALGTVVLPEEVWLWIADINGKHLNKTLEGNI